MSDSLLCERLAVCTEQLLTTESFVLLSEDDLRELGFKLGERKLLTAWIKSTGVYCHVVTCQSCDIAALAFFLDCTFPFYFLMLL